MRYGTPFKSKEDTDISLYEDQCKLIKSYLESTTSIQPISKKRRGIIISLIDMCNQCDNYVIQKAMKNKCFETEIIETENDYYKQCENIVFINMSINNNVNWNITSTCSSSENKWRNYCKSFGVYLYKLKQWCELVETESTPSIATKALLQLLQFWPNFETNIVENKIPDELKKYCNSITTHTFKNDNDNLPNEVCRLIMVCYISLIVYLLNISNCQNYEYILMYHCKSGQDRTGTFYAVNQMVNEITDKYYNFIIKSIYNGNSFEKIYDIFYNMKCTLDKVLLSKELYESIIRHMLFSYLVTYTSAGVPGIKWHLGKKHEQSPYRLGFNMFKSIISSVIPDNITKFLTMIHSENRFPYLLFETPEIAKLFEGCSSLRGA